MAEVHSLEAEPRDRSGTGAARALRRRGRVPAIIYGGDEPPVMISLAERDIKREYHAARFFGTLYNITLGGEVVRVLPYDVQAHPVTDLPMHVDFVRARAGATVTVDIPVAFVNEDICRGLKRGGVLNVVRREIEVVCPVDAIPERIEVDLKDADIGDSLHISQVHLPEGVRPTITDRDFTIAAIVPPTVTPVEEEEAEAAAAEREAEREAEPVEVEREEAAEEEEREER